MGLNGGMEWPIRYTPPVEDMQGMQTDSSFRLKASPSRAGAVGAADMQDTANSRHHKVDQLGGITGVITLCAKMLAPLFGSTIISQIAYLQRAISLHRFSREPRRWLARRASIRRTSPL